MPAVTAHTSQGECDSFLASGDFFRLLITFANSLDQNQDRQNVCPDLDQGIFLKRFILKKSAVNNKSVKNYPACEVLVTLCNKHPNLMN